MADIAKLKPFILRWEGGWSNDPIDRGGATNRGITIATFRQYYGRTATIEQLQKLTEEQWMHIFRDGYWGRFKADEIANQSIANICVDWAWGSGTGTAIRKVQALLRVTVDGIVGAKTIAAINNANQRHLFDKIRQERIRFVEDIVRRDPTQKRFIKGWKNRINSIKFQQ